MSMTKTDKQALREATNAANIASFGKWEAYKPHKGARGYEVKVGVNAVAQHCLKVHAAFIAAANPQTVLALLDELEAKETQRANWFQMAQKLGEDMDVAEKRIAELEARENALRPVGVMSEKAFHRLEESEARFIALWPRPGIYLPRKRPEDGVIVYARTAGIALETGE
ncbi:ead/Ea22-like family protein [Citrobacter sp. OP27]